MNSKDYDKGLKKVLEWVLIENGILAHHHHTQCIPLIETMSKVWREKKTEFIFAKENAAIEKHSGSSNTSK